MRKRLISLAVALTGLCFSALAQSQVIHLYDNIKEKNFEVENRGTFYNISDPTISVVLPVDKSKATGTAMLICPGGGYFAVGMEGEGFNVANYLAQRGITCFVLKYRTRFLGETMEDVQKALPSMFGEIGGDEFTPQGQIAADNAYQDGLKAMEIIKSRASEWGIDKDKVGIIGFSAGSLIAARVGLNHTEASRPALVAPIYLWRLGEVNVPDDAAPLFLCAPQNDLAAPIMSYKTFEAWTAKKVKAELHYISDISHGHGYNGEGRPESIWIELFYNFMKKAVMAN